MIYRLNFGVPPKQIIGKWPCYREDPGSSARCNTLQLAYDDHAANLGTENINWSIKLVARKTALSDKVSSKSVLEKAGLQTLNEMFASQTALMVWKSKKTKDPLGRTFFFQQIHQEAN